MGDCLETPRAAAFKANEHCLGGNVVLILGRVTPISTTSIIREQKPF